MKKRKDGRYERQITLPDGRRVRVYGRTPAELNQRAHEIQSTFDQGLERSGKLTVAEWTSEFLTTYKKKLRENTRASILRNCNLHVLPYIGAMRLEDVRERHCQNAMNDVSTYSEDLQRKVRSIMRQIFDAAIANRMIAINPAANLKITPRAEPQDDYESLTPEQQQDLLRRVDDPRGRAFCALCLYAGLRRGEALGLLWADIDFQRCEIHVRRNLTFPSGNQPDKNRELKTRAANRIVPAPKALIDILLETPKRGLNVIPNTLGQEMTLTAFRRMWRHVTNAVDFHVHPHMLRHSYASSLYRMGINVKTMQRLLGHKDIKTTLGIYTHLSECDNEATSKKIQAFSIA